MTYSKERQNDIKHIALMTYSKGRQNDIKHIALMTYFNMGRVGCELR